MVPILKAGVNLQAVGDEGLLLNINNDQLHQLNPTAFFIVSQCDGKTGLDDILLTITEHFDIDKGTAEQDLKLTLDQLVAADLMEYA